MEGGKLVIDTGIFIEFLRAKEKTKTHLLKIPEEVTKCISVLTLYELLMGATSKEKIKDIQLLTEDLVILPLNVEVAWKASTIYHQLRRHNSLIEFRDLFIAATCLSYNLKILTLNKRHFSRIKGLELAVL